jgi:HlyD family secretion protein
MWRLAAAAAVICTLLGLGYTYVQENPNQTFITAPVERGPISQLVTATGTVDAEITVEVSSQLSGRIADVFVGFNDTVKAGQPLAQLDQEIFVARVHESRAALKVAQATAKVQRAAVERANVEVANAHTAQKMAEAQAAAAQARQSEADKELQRKVELARTGNVTDRDLGQVRVLRDSGAADLRASLEQINMKAQAIAIAEAEFRMAEANLQNGEAVVEEKQAALDQAELDLEHTVVRAPIDGVIINRDVNPGQTVAVSLDAKTLFKLAKDLAEMEVHGKIDEADVGQLKVGQIADFAVDAYPDRSFTGRILQIRKSPEVVQNVVSYTAIISAPNPDLLLLPGMTATIRIVVSNTGEVLKIPNEALRFRPRGAATPEHRVQNAAVASSGGDAATVWVVGEDGTPVQVAVTVGFSNDSSTQLLRGPLTEGQSLIIGAATSKARAGFFGIRLGF